MQAVKSFVDDELVEFKTPNKVFRLYEDESIKFPNRGCHFCDILTEQGAADYCNDAKSQLCSCYGNKKRFWKEVV